MERPVGVWIRLVLKTAPIGGHAHSDSAAFSLRRAVILCAIESTSVNEKISISLPVAVPFLEFVRGKNPARIGHAGNVARKRILTFATIFKQTT